MSPGYGVPERGPRGWPRGFNGRAGGGRDYLLWAVAAPVLLLLALPLLAIFLALDPGRFWAGLTAPVTTAALRVSFLATTTSLAALVIAGTPLAYLLARRTFYGRRAVEALVDLPLAIPPAVMGVGLLLAFGRYGLVGRWFDQLFGWRIGFSFTAVVLAQVIVAAPLYLRSAQEAFAAVDPMLPGIARTLGASRWRAFRQVFLPLAAPGLLSGAGMAWARALGEFGATILFAGNLPGRTQTLPLAVYTAFETDINVALAISAFLAVFGFAVLVAWKAAANRWRRRWLEPVP